MRETDPEPSVFIAKDIGLNYNGKKKKKGLPAPLAETFEHQCVRIRHQQTSVIYLPLFHTRWGLSEHISDNTFQKALTHF